MQLTFDEDVESFRADFATFLDQNLPDEADTVQRSQNCSDIPDWARRWQRRLFDDGWLMPGNPPEFGGRNASVLQQYVHLEELAKRRIYRTFNPQGVTIVAATILSAGTDEQKQRWAVPLLKAEMTASVGMSEPGAGSDLASLSTRAVRDGDHYVVNGQKVWTSGAHDADVLLTFVRTDPEASKHRGLSVLLIPTSTPGVVCRPFPNMTDQHELDFNEVFLTDVRVPVENLVGEENKGWQVASSSLGHERAMIWILSAERMQYLVDDYRPADAISRDSYARLLMDLQALRLLGGTALARAGRGEEGMAELSVLKVLGVEAEIAASEQALESAAADGLMHPAATAPYAPMNLDYLSGSWFERYARSFLGGIAGGTTEIQKNIIAQQGLGLPRTI